MPNAPLSITRWYRKITPFTFVTWTGYDTFTKCNLLRYIEGRKIRERGEGGRKKVHEWTDGRREWEVGREGGKEGERRNIPTLTTPTARIL